MAKTNVYTFPQFKHFIRYMYMFQNNLAEVKKKYLLEISSTVTSFKQTYVVKFVKSLNYWI